MIVGPTPVVAQDWYETHPLDWEIGCGERAAESGIADIAISRFSLDARARLAIQSRDTA
jgi:hypothetical protein